VIEPTVRVRPATDDDAEDIAQIWYDAWADGHRGNVPDALLAFRTRDQFSSRAAERVPHSWIAEVDGRSVGFVTVDGDEIEQIFVHSSARGTGLASMLLDEGLRAIRDAGHGSAWLAVVAGNARARAFYEKRGWRDAGPFDYQAQTTEGPIDVPCRRYVTDLP
jgi:GNAT superfamily N-acetyltransferase